jgi:hypothetical protein
VVFHCDVDGATDGKFTSTISAQKAFRADGVGFDLLDARASRSRITQSGRR